MSIASVLSCTYYISWDAHALMLIFQHAAPDSPGKNEHLSICPLRCTHLSCMVTRMKIHKWKSQRVCLFACASAILSGGVSSPGSITRRHSHDLLNCDSRSDHSARVLLCLQGGSREDGGGIKPWWESHSKPNWNPIHSSWDKIKSHEELSHYPLGP